MWSQELYIVLSWTLHCALRESKELKVNRSEIFDFALRRCLYFTWCNNLFVNTQKFYTGDLTAYIPRYWTCEETETPRMIRFKSYSSNTVQIWWHVNLHCVLHNISQFSLPVSCRFMYGKVRENVEALLSLFSKYKLFVYGIELWTQKRHAWFISCLIYVGLNFPL